jgi:hypothetical protein
MTSAFGGEPRRMLRIIQRVGKHCICRLQGECVVVGRNKRPKSYTLTAAARSKGQELKNLLLSVEVWTSNLVVLAVVILMLRDCYSEFSFPRNDNTIYFLILLSIRRKSH